MQILAKLSLYSVNLLDDTEQLATQEQHQFQLQRNIIAQTIHSLNFTIFKGNDVLTVYIHE